MHISDLDLDSWLLIFTTTVFSCFRARWFIWKMQLFIRDRYSMMCIWSLIDMRVLKVDTFYKKYAYLFHSVRMLRQPVIFQIIIEIEVLRIYFHVNKTCFFFPVSILIIGRLYNYRQYRITDHHFFLQVDVFGLLGFFFWLFQIGPSSESDFIGFICKTVKIIVNCTITLSDNRAPMGYGIICKGGCLILFISV